MADSIFTKIIKGEIPCHKIYEDNMTLAFLDIHPVQPGHVLVVPKKEVSWIWDLPDEEYLNLMGTVKKVGIHMRESFKPKHIGIVVAGVGVPHVHVHLIPFTTEGELKAPQDMTAEPNHPALATMAAKLAL